MHWRDPMNLESALKRKIKEEWSILSELLEKVKEKLKAYRDSTTPTMRSGWRRGIFCSSIRMV